MTTKALVPVLQKLAGCRRDTDVIGVAMVAAKGTFACHVDATLFLDQSLASTERDFFGMHLDDVQEYEDRGRPVDRVFSAVIIRAAVLARVSGESVVDVQDSGPLAPHERQVASLAAAGRTNVEIALALGIARETVEQTLRRASFT